MIQLELELEPKITIAEVLRSASVRKSCRNPTLNALFKIKFTVNYNHLNVKRDTKRFQVFHKHKHNVSLFKLSHRAARRVS